MYDLLLVFYIVVKKPDPYYISEDMLQPLLQQMFKMASHSTDTSLEMSSSFINCLINNCLMYARPDRTQTLLQLVFQKFQKSFKMVFVYPFVANSFTDLFAQNLQTHTEFKK